MKVGTVQSIWRYPVKGMAGEAVNTARLGVGGLEGDRLWAVQDLRRKELQSCKFRPDLLKARASCRLGVNGRPDGQVDIEFPEQQAASTDDPERANALISNLVGQPSMLQKQKPLAGNEAFYRRFKEDDHTWLEELKATFTREPGEPLPDLDNLPPLMQEYVSIPGTFFLVSPFHLLTTASLNHMRNINPAADWALERFRPNLVIDTTPGLQGLVEQDWLGKTLQVGRVRFSCSDAAPRCGAVTRAQANFGADPSILRSIVREADQNLGIYADLLSEGSIQLGDEVHLLA